MVVVEAALFEADEYWINIQYFNRKALLSHMVNARRRWLHLTGFVRPKRSFDERPTDEVGNK